MQRAHIPEPLELPTTFKFDTPSPELQALKHALFSGYMVQIELIEGIDEGETQVRRAIHVVFGEVDYEAAVANAKEQCFPEAEVSQGESVTRLGVASPLATLITETIDAGFLVYLIPESDRGSVSGHCTLVYVISDNS